MTATRLPAFQFYPADWLKDPALRRVSLAARGLWIDLLCFMSEAEPRGHLQDAFGNPLDATHVARMAGCALQCARKLIQELELSGAFSRTESGVIFCRRMVRDETIRQQNKANGSKGGNPALKKPHNPPDNRESNRNLTPSSSSSTSESIHTPLTEPGEWSATAGAYGERQTFLIGHSEAFKRWWGTYPLRKGIDDAWPEWQAAILRIQDRKNLPESAAEQWLLMVTEDYAKSPAGKTPPGTKDFRWTPANFLSGGHFDDDRDTWRKPNGEDKINGTNNIRRTGRKTAAATTRNDEWEDFDELFDRVVRSKPATTEAASAS